MNRLEEIKERLDKVTHLRGNKGFDAREEFESCAEADIDYLLSLNEQYRNYLIELREKTPYGLYKEQITNVLQDEYEPK